MVCKAYMMFLFFECCLILEEFICCFALVCVCVYVCVCVNMCMCLCAHPHFNENFLSTTMTVQA